MWEMRPVASYRHICRELGAVFINVQEVQRGKSPARVQAVSPLA